MREIFDIWFSNLDLENYIKLQLLESFSSKEIYNMNINDYIKNKINDEIIFKVQKDKNLDDAKKNYEYMVEKNINLICVRDKTYPQKLHNISDKPAFLYVRGNKNILNDDAVGIVGCRIASNFGKSTARIIAKQLADRNINVISGLAIGIDKYAHLGALDSEIGKTIAVLGCGIDDESIYPSENFRVFERIIENGGAVITEYPINAKPEKSHFPARNRIISGLSDRIIVVEAKSKSGSLITANWAIEQGKDVFAVPGNIFSKNSVGTNSLIKEGAYLFSNISDILYDKII